MKTVLYIISNDSVGGAEICFKSLPSSEDISNVHFIKELLPWSGHSLYDGYCQIRRLRSLVRKHKVDLIVSSLWRAHVLTLFVNRNVQIIPFFHSSRYRSWIDRLVSETVKYRAGSFGIFVDAESTKEFHQINYSGNISVVSMLTNTKTISPKRYSDVFIPSTFVYVGRIDPIKNISATVILLERYAELADIKVVFSLYGPISRGYSLPSSKIIDITYKGVLPSEKVLGKIAQYDIFISLSKVEGYAMTARSALSVGMICVLTSVGDLSKILVDDINAIVHRELETTARKLSEIGTDDVQRLSKNALLLDEGVLFQDSFYDKISALYAG